MKDLMSFLSKNVNENECENQGGYGIHQALKKFHQKILKTGVSGTI